MTVKELFSGYSFIRGDNSSQEIVESLCVDSRQVTASSVFIAVRGHQADGHGFLKNVCEKKVLGVIVEDDSSIPDSFSGFILKTSDSRKTLDELSARFQNYPSRELFSVGLTGTNGKTTVSYMTEWVFNALGSPMAVMGTVDHHLGATSWETELTTPGPIELQGRLREFADHGAKSVVMEISSHALDQKRAGSVDLDLAVFTNFSRDHLDYHKDMDDYFQAKEKLFSEVLVGSDKARKCAILNSDDKKIHSMVLPKGIEKKTFGQKSADFQFSVGKMGFGGSEFEVCCEGRKVKGSVGLPGLFNVYNAACVFAIGAMKGFALEDVSKALGSFVGVPGRLEPVANPDGLHIFVDYAHTDHALKSVLKSLAEIRRQSSSKAKIFVVFGAGGDRDHGKRPLMAKAVEELADGVVVTTDNPRKENPQKIIDEIVAGFSDKVKASVNTVVDRKEAIHLALEGADFGDVVLIAGKGHEDYQIVGDEKRAYSDVSAIKECFDE